MTLLRVMLIITSSRAEIILSTCSIEAGAPVSRDQAGEFQFYMEKQVVVSQ